MKKFVVPFHGLRGVASVMVLIAHLTDGFYINTAKLYPVEIQSFISNIGAFGVEIFFILSGYVIFVAAQNGAARVFFKHRFWRIYPLFFLFTLLYFIGNHFLKIEPDRDSFVILVTNLLFLDRFFDTPALTPNAWSLTFEAWYYYITFFFVFFLRHRGLSFNTVFSLFVFLFFISCYPVTIYFVLGVFLAYLNINYSWCVRDVILATTIQFLSLIALFYFVGNGVEFGSNGWGGLLLNPVEFLLPLLLFLFMSTLVNEKAMVSRALSQRLVLFLGGISYSLYLAHPYTYLLSRKIVEKIPLLSQGYSFLFFITFSILFSIGLAYVVNVYVENRIYARFVKKDIYK